MLVCLPFSGRDSVLALANLRWMQELGGCAGHDILLFVDEGVGASEHLDAACQFKTARVVQVDLPTTTKWPLSQNHVWKRIVDYVDHFKLYPFLLCESDAIPVRVGWLDAIEDEFIKFRKPFIGYLEYAGDPARQHMNGVGVYSDIHRFAPGLLSAPTDDNGSNYLAFDWAGGPEVVPQMHVSRLFQFQYKKEAELLKDETLSWLNPDAAIFHTCKDVRIFDQLRKRFFPNNQPGGAGANLATFAGSRSVRKHPESPGADEQKPSLLSTDIFVKTYDKVADWHGYAMRSIDRFCSGFRTTVVIAQQRIESYAEMQIHKLNADLYTDADYILTTDSDTIFTMPVTPRTYMEDGKTIWLHRTWDDALATEGDAVMRWKRGMKRFFAIEPPFEFMCRHPELIPRWLYSAFRIFCVEHHGKMMEECVREEPDFADWNILGMYAWLYHQEAFFWINQSEGDAPPVTVRQYWGGHESIGPHAAEMEAILAGGVDIVHAPPGPVLRSAATPTAKEKRIAGLAKARAVKAAKKATR